MKTAADAWLLCRGVLCDLLNQFKRMIDLIGLN